jgi:hypothetical protein
MTDQRLAREDPEKTKSRVLVLFPGRDYVKINDRDPSLRQGQGGFTWPRPFHPEIMPGKVPDCVGIPVRERKIVNQQEDA